MSNQLNDLRLGERITRQREKCGMSRSSLALAIGLSAEAVSAIEAGLQVPSLVELMAIADALHSTIGTLCLPTSPAARVEFVRAADRWKVEPQTDQATQLNYHYEALSYRLTEKRMSPFLIEVSPNQVADLPLSSHDGEEFLFLLSGELIVTIEDHKYAMRAGDSLYFDSRLKHSVRPSGSQPARMIACIAQDHKETPANPIDRSF